MAQFLLTNIADGATNQEDSNSIFQRFRNVIDRKIFFVDMRNDFLSIIDITKLRMMFSILKKDAACSDVIGRGVQAVNKIGRE